MSQTHTEYVVVADNGTEADKVAKLFDSGYTLVKSWVANNSVHHLLTIEGKP